MTPRSLVEWHKYFKGTCCLHLQGRRCKLSRREIYVIQCRECRECRDSNSSSKMAAYAVYTEGRGSRLLQTLAPIYHTTHTHIPAHLNLKADCHKTSVLIHLVSFHFVVQCSQQTCRTQPDGSSSKFCFSIGLQ